MVQNGEASKRKMEKQACKETKPQSESGKESLEGLPIEDSPYVKYKDLEDYKRQGYGTQGHQEPKTGRGAGATEAPTLSGAAVSSDAQVTATDTINRQGVP
ncbi:Late embryogenesis abundant protein, LEA-18 [Spatholobus suberectus]|nr:Late embryogenesis abundant protein, LEA-18 [Spatholobus suberectus]